MKNVTPVSVRQLMTVGTTHAVLAATNTVGKPSFCAYTATILSMPLDSSVAKCRCSDDKVRNIPVFALVDLPKGGAQ